MELLPHHSMDMPAIYRICVHGSLESNWAERLWGMATVPVEDDVAQERTVLVGEVSDQAALVGIINTLFNMGHTVESIEHVIPEDDLSSNSTDGEA